MATVTTTKKKKLVYKQDRDGVFRLKKVDGDGDEAPSKPEEDSLNELLDCSYKIIDHGKDQPSQVVMSIPPAPSTMPDPSFSAAGEVQSSTLAKVLRAHDSRRKKKSIPKTPKQSTPTSATSSPPEPAKFSTLRMIQNEAVGQVKQFHPPSFGLGLAVAAFVYASRAVLVHYALVLFNVLKFAVLWGVLVGGLCWWFGVIKPQDTERLTDAWGNIKAKFGLGRPAEAEESDDESDDDVHGDIRSNGSVASEHSASSLTDDHSVAPTAPVYERRNTLTKVTPFKPIPKSEKYSSTPDLLQHMKAQPPKLNRINTTGLRSIPQKTSPPKNISPRKSRHGSVDSGASFKRLPPQPKEAEELPFINEVKLVSADDEDSLVSLDDFPKRSNTTMSKKSVLGTRSNYNRFLANVNDDGYED